MEGSLWNKKGSDYSPEPLSLLVYKFVTLRSETRKGSACATRKWLTYAVASLGYNLENINLWSRIAQNFLFHNAFEISMLNYSVNYSTEGFVANAEQPSAEATSAVIAPV